MKKNTTTANQLTVEMWAIARVKPYPKNARKLSDKAVAKVAASLKEFGWRQPCVVDKKGVLVAGHTRLLAAQSLGMTEVPVHVAANLTPVQCRAYRLADNRVAAESSFDLELLGPELLELQALDLDLSLTGFDADELKMFMADPTEGLTDPDDCPAPQAEAISVAGDLWLLGEHRLLCGDSTSVTDVERLMAGEKADMVFADPPYGIDYQDVKRNHAKLAGDSTLAGIPDLLRVVLLNECPMFICCNWKSLPTFTLAMTEAGRNPKSCIVWDKLRGVQNLDRFYKRHEFILYAGPFGGERTVDGDVWTCERQVRSDHPTAKPVELIDRAMNSSCVRGGIVQDLFGGSGSTLIACEKGGRVGRLMELSPQYADVICRRFMAFTGKQATLESGRTFAGLEAERSPKSAAA